MKSCKSAPSIHKQQSMLAVPLAALATPTKVHSSFQSIMSQVRDKCKSAQEYYTVKIAICTSAMSRKSLL